MKTGICIMCVLAIFGGIAHGQNNPITQDDTVERLFKQELDMLKRDAQISTTLLGVSMGLIGVGGITSLTSQTLQGAGLIAPETAFLAEGISFGTISIGMIGAIISFIVYEAKTREYIETLEIQANYRNLQN